MFVSVRGFIYVKKQPLSIFIPFGFFFLTQHSIVGDFPELFQHQYIYIYSVFIILYLYIMYIICIFARVNAHVIPKL